MFTTQSVSRMSFVLLVFACVFALSFGALGITPAQAQAATTWYVTTAGDDSNVCSDTSTPCLTINGALGQASAGDTIQVATGIYPEGVFLNKAITLSGGWDTGFTSQSGFSTLDGQATYRSLTINTSPVVVDRFKIQNGVDSVFSGSGILIFGTLTLNNSIVTNNVSHSKGGGIYVDHGVLIVNNSTISGNKGGNNYSGGGAGIENDHGTVTINNSTVSNNFPGGIDNVSTSMTLNNSTVSGNTGKPGILNTGNLTVNNSTISNNYQGIRNFGAIVLQNSIVAGNTGMDCFGPGAFTSAGYNLINSNSECWFNPSLGDQIGDDGNPIDPLLGPLQNNGGLTFTHALLGGSPAFNAGNPATPGGGSDACLASDQRGITRTTSRCDIGAYEVNGPMVASIKRVSTSPINATSVDFTVTFTEVVTGVDATDFALTITALTGASVTNVSGSDAVYTVTVNTGSANGTIRLDLVDDDSIVDGMTTPLGGLGIGNGNTTSGEIYIMDNTPPTVLSIVRKDIEINHYNMVNFKVAFSEPVAGVDATDFILTNAGLTGVSITNITVSDATPTIYTVSVNTGLGDSTLRLDVADDDSVIDLASNPLGGVGPANGNFVTGESYTIDKTRPSVLSIVRADSNPTTAASVNFTVTFSEAVTGVDATRFKRTTTGLGGTSITGVSGSGATYTVTINTGTGTGTLHIDLIDIDDHIKDLASNYLAEDPEDESSDFTKGETYTINRPVDTTGPLDTTFGVNGFVSTRWNASDGQANAVAVQPNGKIVVVGTTVFGSIRVVLLERYNVNGTLDTTFGEYHTGVITTQISGFDVGASIAIQPDSKIVISAYTGSGVVLVRYNANGSLDLTFGTNGRVNTQTQGFYSSIVIQPNGQIVVASRRNITYSDSSFILLRYNSNGSLDTSFGTNGKVETDFGSTKDDTHAIVLQPDGKIVVAGDNGLQGFALARYNQNGSLDTSFGNAGKVITNFTGGFANDLALQPDGKIIVTGISYNLNLIALVRYNSNGSLDNTFDTDGIVTTAIGQITEDSGSSVVLLPNGKIMVSSSNDNGTTSTFALLRYKNNGALDTTFGTGGITTTAIGGSAWSCDLAFQPDGKLIVAGNSYTDHYGDFTLARYNVGYSVPTATFTSNAAQDGWVLESSETSNTGGAISSTGLAFVVGDHATKKQYRSVLSFNTGSLPDTAVITGVTLKIKKHSITGGGNPVTMFQGFMADMKNGFFGSTALLEIADFQSAPNKTAGPLSSTPVNNIYTFNLIYGKDAINKLATNGGLTQIRLRFKLDDNNDAVANYLSLFSGNATVAADRPQLVITYTVP